MIDVLLIDNLFISHAPTGPRATFYPHLGLLSIAAELNAAGLRTRVLDPKMEYCRYLESGVARDFDSLLVDAILGHRPRIVGLTAYGLNFHHVVVWVRRMRACAPSVKIALGGPHVSMLADEVADYLPEADLLVLGECESRIAAVFDACIQDRVPRVGRTRIRNGVMISEAGPQRELDPCKLPDVALYVNAPDIDAQRFAFPLEAGRGCPYECTFCSTSEYFGRRYRVRTPHELVHDIEQLRERLGVSSFDLTHDLFGLRKQFVREFCSLVQPLNVSWQCSMRPDQLLGDTARLLASSGCTDVYLGFETGSPVLQSSIKKRLDLVQAEQAVAVLLQMGIGVTCSFITGFPEETELDLDDTLDLTGKILQMSRGSLILQLHLLSPEPGSELGRQAVAGLQFDGIGPDLQPVSRLELVKANPRIFANHYYLESIAGRELTVLASTFVMHVLPTIGYSFVAWLVRQTAQGSLSALFRDVRTGLPPVRESSIDVLRVGMVDACYRRAADHLGDVELLKEYSRFREAVLYLSNCADLQGSLTTETTGTEEGRSFKYIVARDVVAFIQALDQGVSPADVCLPNDERRWQIAVFQSGSSVRATSTLLAQAP